MLGALVSSWKTWGSQQGRLLSRGGTQSDLRLAPSPGYSVETRWGVEEEESLEAG